MARPATIYFCYPLHQCQVCLANCSDLLLIAVSEPPATQSTYYTCPSRASTASQPSSLFFAPSTSPLSYSPHTPCVENSQEPVPEPPARQPEPSPVLPPPRRPHLRRLRSYDRHRDVPQWALDDERQRMATAETQAQALPQFAAAMTRTADAVDRIAADVSHIASSLAH